MAANFAVSAGSTLALRGAAGSLSLGAESVMPSCEILVQPCLCQPE